MTSEIENMLWACAFVLACMGFYKFVLPALRRFDQENIRRIARQENDKSDPEAHIRHALETAEEQVEDVQEIRTGATVQYLFEAAVYPSREQAEEARAMRVGTIARRFYQELPAALAGSKTRGRMSARERAAQRWGKRKDQNYH
jgi:F0F1-type ATP synthase membrane subunit b/b'